MEEQVRCSTKAFPIIEKEALHMKAKLMALLASSVCAVPAVAWAQTADPTTNEGVGIVAWIIIGLIAGYLASHIVNKSGEGMVLDIILGIVGAFIGGVIFRMVGSSGVTGFNVWSIFVAFIGAVVLLVLYHAIRGRGRIA
jgi:uncharacterized membrane protein YeaQ/YmgE (transglycosylase-associated protein family)